MSGYFGITDSIRKAFNDTGRINTITHGDLSMVDLSRQTIYPLVHVVSQGATFEGNVTDYTFGVTVMDIVDFNRDNPDDLTEPFYGNDNTQDILHDLSTTIELALDELRRGDLYSDLFRLAEGGVSGTAFISDGENMLAGWNITINTTTLSASVSNGLQ